MAQRLGLVLATEQQTMQNNHWNLGNSLKPNHSHPTYEKQISNIGHLQLLNDNDAAATMQYVVARHSTPRGSPACEVTGTSQTPRIEEHQEEAQEHIQHAAQAVAINAWRVSDVGVGKDDSDKS